MPVSFEDQLALVDGKIHRLNIASRFEWMRDGLLYYWNCAERLHTSAKIIYDAKGPPEVFAMLAGLSIELLLKGTCRALDQETPMHHELYKLCCSVGITIDKNDRVILEALTEHVLWAGRYPAPTKPGFLVRAMRIFDKQRRKSGNLANLYYPETEINMENYEKLWEMFASYYHRARDVRPESAEFLYDK